MYSQALQAIIFIGNLKVFLIAFGWVSFITVIILAFCNFIDFNSWGRIVLNSFLVFFTLTAIACLSIYHAPGLKEEIIIAKQVAPVLDRYAENNPESIYNPDIILGAVDDTIKGIVGSAIELPKYIAKLASGGIPALLPLSERPIDSLTREELEQRLRDAERNKR